MLFWLRQAGVLLVFGLMVFAFSGVRQTPYKLLSMYQDFWARGDTLRREWRTERSGESSLPEVRTMLALLRDNQVAWFRYSDGIARHADVSVALRLAEGAYPIRVGLDAHHLLLLAGEALDPRCRVVANRQEVVLAFCP